MIVTIGEDVLKLVNQRIQVLTREKEGEVNKLIPIFQSIAVGGILKLISNRIRYNALINFLKHKVKADISIETAESIGKQEGTIVAYGESVMGILFPDKKSALALQISQKLNCKSSVVMKGLAFFLGVLVIEFKKEEDTLSDFTAFCQNVIQSKSQFSDHISPEIQKVIIDILLLNDVLKVDLDSLNTSNEDVEKYSETNFSAILSAKNIGIALVILIFVGISLFFLVRKSNEEEVSFESEEIIPLDSLNKLNDSLTQAVVDSAKLDSDSTQILAWPGGKDFVLPKQSAIVTLHSFLMDSTQTEKLLLPTYEFSFDNSNDQISTTKDYFFKRFVEGLQTNKNSKLEIFTFSDQGTKAALKRGFILKNRLVGEGLSPIRIEVKSGTLEVKPDNSIALNAQVVFRVSK
ncbi:hypothetical protein EOJ36_02210 [Sandaracinomonas limnophila]|uniref:Uncharacterized protein n=1 Tax=Sandaracinomonas limnophila TaxID=1862386 RepID=A0A437PX68_9BACT|nr:hypothetical protein [Sandaracinomonas limnophila]RVU26830.1 hypothetical protein EOJ36_02210 [Sandaracinomonas limnophila]